MILYPNAITLKKCAQLQYHNVACIVYEYVAGAQAPMLGSDIKCVPNYSELRVLIRLFAPYKGLH